VTLGSAPSVVDYCALAVVVITVDAFYLSHPRFQRRIGGRQRFVRLALGPCLVAAILLVCVPKFRYVWWWLPVLQVGLPVVIGALAPPIMLIRRRSRWPSIQPHERRWAAASVGLVVTAALTAPIGTAVVTIATGDFRLAFAVSVAAATLMRWRMLIRIRRVSTSA
jgi:MFS family permease